MSEYNKYLVRIEYPHDYTPDRNVSFSTKDKAEAFARYTAGGTLGVAGYVRTTVYRRVKEFS